MESFFSRYRNAVVFAGLVLVQIIALAAQVKRPDPARPHHDEARLLRIWTIESIAPFERVFIHSGESVRTIWHGYIDLRNVNRTNSDLQAEVNQLRMEQVRMSEEARQGRRLSALLQFKEQYVQKTIAAQVIGTSGTNASRIVYIDKGSRDGLNPDLPVITPDGIVGKVREVYPTTSQVLLLNDQQSGVGVILEKSRKQGILSGSANGALDIHFIMADEKIEPGEKVYTNGGDRIFPRGLEIGQVAGATPDKDSSGFQIIHVKPNADLARLEEVLVVTQIADKSPSVDDEHESPAQLLAGHLPGIDEKVVAANSQGENLAIPPPLRPEKAISPDRFSPPEDLTGVHMTAAVHAQPLANARLERTTSNVATTRAKASVIASPSENTNLQPISEH